MAKSESEKLSHAAVKYESPAKMNDFCLKCQHFEAKGFELSCELVKKPIKMFDWCNRYEKRES